MILKIVPSNPVLFLRFRKKMNFIKKKLFYFVFKIKTFWKKISKDERIGYKIRLNFFIKDIS